MRLTRTIKGNIYNIIKNNTIIPTNKDNKLDKLTEKLQNIIYQKEPLFREFINHYGYTGVFNTCIRFDGFAFYLLLPVYKNADNKVIYFFDKEFYGNTFFKDYYKGNVEEFNEVLDELLALEEEVRQYNDTLQETYNMINNCNTLKQLLTILPEVEPYLDKLGLNKEKKFLPVNPNLINKLNQYGFNTKNNLEEEIRKEVVEAENKND